MAGAKSDPYETIRTFLNISDSNFTDVEVSRYLLNLFDGKEDLGNSDNACRLINLKKHAKSLWPKLKEGNFLNRFLSEEEQTKMLLDVQYAIESRNQLICLVAGMIILMEELVNSPNLVSKVNSDRQRSRDIIEVGKSWEFNKQIPVQQIKLDDAEKEEAYESAGAYIEVLENRRMTPYKIQNIFLMLCFKAVQLYYKTDLRLKTVLVIPPLKESLYDLVDIIDPSKLMVKVARCFIYELRDEDQFVSEKLFNPRFEDALI